MEAYLQERDDLISQIKDMKYDDLVFTKEEEAANTVFRSIISSQRKNTPAAFYRGNSMKYKALIDQCDLFKIVKKMPKGAVLHLHVDCAIDPEFVKFAFFFFSSVILIFQKFCEITNNENVYYHVETKQMIYRKDAPMDPKFKKWIERRRSSENTAKFDKDFRDSISISPEDSESGANLWDLFMDKIIQTNPVIFYCDNFKKYLVNVFKNFIEEGVSHIEARALLGSVLNEVFSFYYIKIISLIFKNNIKSKEPL